MPQQMKAMARRMSRAMVEGIRRADAETLRAEIEHDPGPEHPILPDVHLRAYARRRQYVLDHIDRITQQYGEDVIYAWP